ncbi:MAG: hypothetical protein J2P51_13715 [Hyphomicrobiaceae bacterium]|nr:hypothetical protein [Hyphomicrobiaceae bacterium]
MLCERHHWPQPTWGRVSRHGVFPLAASLDHIGPMTRSAADAGAMLAAIAGADANDPTSLAAPVPNYLTGLDAGARGLRIGIDTAYNETGSDPEIIAAVREARKALEGLGVLFKEVKVPNPEAAMAAWEDLRRR